MGDGTVGAGRGSIRETAIKKRMAKKRIAAAKARAKAHAKKVMDLAKKMKKERESKK